MKIDIRKHFLYKYVVYRFNKECRKDVTWDRLSAEDRDRFCLHVFRRVCKRVTGYRSYILSCICDRDGVDDFRFPSGALPALV